MAAPGTRGRPKGSAMPPFYDMSTGEAATAEYIRTCLATDDLIEFVTDYDQGSGLLLVGTVSRATGRGVLVDGVLLGCSDKAWYQWYAGHSKVDALDLGGLFHFCTGQPCRGSSSESERAQVHVAKFRPLTGLQARTLKWAQEGLDTLVAEVSARRWGHRPLETRAAATRLPRRLQRSRRSW